VPRTPKPQTVAKVLVVAAAVLWSRAGLFAQSGILVAANPVNLNVGFELPFQPTDGNPALEDEGPGSALFTGVFQRDDGDPEYLVGIFDASPFVFQAALQNDQFTSPVLQLTVGDVYSLVAYPESGTLSWAPGVLAPSVAAAPPPPPVVPTDDPPTIDHALLGAIAELGFDPTPIPEPPAAAAWLAVAALAAAIAFRRRRRSGRCPAAALPPS
jgi:MYXO-CTERM domain-containing protein